MCYPTTCPTCQQPTWGGCGQHIEAALKGVPVDKRCHCKAATQEEFDSKAGGGSTCSAQ